MSDMTAAEEISGDARARSNVVRLAAAQALTGANAAVIFATGSIVGASLAPDISLATVPISMYVAGLAAGTLPTGAISRAYGRRVAFIVGTGCGMLTGLLGAFAILHASFPLFCGATFLGGLYGSVSQSYRFAAADGASAAFRPKAVSWVMAGGVFAGVLGPQLVQWTMDVWQPYLFAFSFVVQAMVALIAMAVLAGVDAPKPAPSDLHGGRPLSELARHPARIAAGLAGATAQTTRFEFRYPVASRCDVRPELFYGIPYCAPRGATDCRAWPVARSRRRHDRPVRHHGVAFLGHTDRARRRLEFCLRRRFRAGAGDASAAGAQQGSG